MGCFGTRRRHHQVLYKHSVANGSPLVSRVPAQHRQLDELTSVSLPQVRKLEVGLVEIRGFKTAVGQVGVEETCRFSVAIIERKMVGGERYTPHVATLRCVWRSSAYRLDY